MTDADADIYYVLGIAGVVCAAGKPYHVMFYSLPMILAIGYKVKGTGEFQDLDGEYNQISVGVFGHIFTFNKEDLDKAIDNAL